MGVRTLKCRTFGSSFLSISAPAWERSRNRAGGATKRAIRRVPFAATTTRLFKGRRA
ncbi:MAG: hypothetical protein M3Y74_23270 [Chloroflexota bacterium]|nr:hypothetical protein [Chloroflexota bacterium]